MENNPDRTSFDSSLNVHRYYDSEGIEYRFNSSSLGPFIFTLCRFLLKFNSVFRIWQRSSLLSMFSIIFVKVSDSPSSPALKVSKPSLSSKGKG